MGDTTMAKEYPNGNQRYAICQAQWNGKAQSVKVPSGLFLRSDTGEVKIEAAQADKPALRRFQMTAYTGGAMNLGGWPHPVVVDLAGLVIGKKSRPILMDHDSGRIVGHTNAVLSNGGTLSVTGVISGVGPAAQEVIGASDNGFPWQASLGANAKKVVFVPEGKAATANGQEFEGPAYIVRQSRLGEVSFVALGADDNTSASVEATGNGNSLMEVMTMDFETWVKAKGKDLAALTDAEVADLKAEYEARDEAVVLEKRPTVEASVPAATAPTRIQANAQPAVPAPVPAAVAPPVVTAAAPAVSPVDVKAEAAAAIKTERERVSAIQEVCAGEFPQIERDAIRLGWSLDDTRQKVLKAMRDNRPQADVHMAVRKEGGMDTRKKLEAALCFRAGIDEKTVLAAYGEQITAEAYPDRDMSLQQLFVECAKLEGVTLPRHFCNDTIRAGFSTLSLPGLLSNVANKKLLKSFRAQPVIATQLCSEGELNDFKESERYRLTDVGDLELVPTDGEIKHGGLAEEKATNQLKTYGKMFTLTRQHVFNDDLSAFLRIPEGMGARAARKIDQIFFQRLLANPDSLFSTGHANYKEGADTALSADSLAAAIQLFMDQVDVDNQPVNIAPKFLLLPTALKMVGRELLNSSILLSVGATNKQRIPTYNPLTDENLEIVSSPYLSNANYAGASLKSWYLFADPAVADTWEIAYLRGRREPVVEQSEADFDRLGFKFRVYYDVGIKEQDYRGQVKFKGE